ncbi:hypothetical protein [Aliikangiella maris]|uniref:Uncharacterized protein n=2 Tax=Aliikangiella maris TaxID=3162458 RepID=A0ABV3MNX1_9GAMM
MSIIQSGNLTLQQLKKLQSLNFKHAPTETICFNDGQLRFRSPITSDSTLYKSILPSELTAQDDSFDGGFQVVYQNCWHFKPWIGYWKFPGYMILSISSWQHPQTNGQLSSHILLQKAQSKFEQIASLAEDGLTTAFNFKKSGLFCRLTIPSSEDDYQAFQHNNLIWLYGKQTNDTYTEQSFYYAAINPQQIIRIRFERILMIGKKRPEFHQCNLEHVWEQAEKSFMKHCHFQSENFSLAKQQALWKNYQGTIHKKGATQKSASHHLD